MKVVVLKVQEKGVNVRKAQKPRVICATLAKERRAGVDGTLRLWGNPMDPDQIARACAIPVKSALRDLAELEREGKVRRVGDKYKTTHSDRRREAMWC